jgi:hypothetical protein
MDMEAMAAMVTDETARVFCGAYCGSLVSRPDKRRGYGQTGSVCEFPDQAGPYRAFPYSQ